MANPDPNSDNKRAFRQGWNDAVRAFDGKRAKYKRPRNDTWMAMGYQFGRSFGPVSQRIFDSAWEWSVRQYRSDGRISVAGFVPLEGFFKEGHSYSRKKISEILGGDEQSYLPSHHVHIVYGAFRLDVDPDAPNVILPGPEKRVYETAKQFCAQEYPIPIFLRVKTNTWEYVGNYKVDRWTEDPKIIAKHEGASDRHDVSRVVFLLKSESGETKDLLIQEKDLEEKVRTGAGFGSPETNKKVEKAAILFATGLYEKQGWEVESVEQKKIGYDLLCKKGKQRDHVEVKGIKGSSECFIITAREVQQARINPCFKICVVTSALSKHPALHQYHGADFIDAFQLKPLAFRAKSSQRA